jgi:hypothetical protein
VHVRVSPCILDIAELSLSLSSSSFFFSSLLSLHPRSTLPPIPLAAGAQQSSSSSSSAAAADDDGHDAPNPNQSTCAAAATAAATTMQVAPVQAHGEVAESEIEQHHSVVKAEAMTLEDGVHADQQSGAKEEMDETR